MKQCMDHIIDSFNSSTNWDSLLSYENITLTSRNLLDFKIPRSFSFSISNCNDILQNTSFNTLTIRTSSIVDGSLTYLYSNVPVKHTPPNLQALVQTLQVSGNRINKDLHLPEAGASLYYGKMHYLDSHLEAMYMKRLNSNNQLILKCLSTLPQHYPTGQLNIITLNWQRKSRNHASLHDLYLSTNDLLTGYRFLHRFNKNFCLGTEFWMGLATLSPTCSATMKYTNHTSLLQRPMELTLSLNPLFGHLSSSYSSRVNSRTNFSTRYDFNIYSIDSNLSMGLEYWHNLNNIWKISTSLRDQRTKLLWESNFKGFVISVGTEVTTSSYKSSSGASLAPQINGKQNIDATAIKPKVGIQVQYNYA